MAIPTRNRQTRNSRPRPDLREAVPGADTLAGECLREEFGEGRFVPLQRQARPEMANEQEDAVTPEQNMEGAFVRLRKFLLPMAGLAAKMRGSR